MIDDIGLDDVQTEIILEGNSNYEEDEYLSHIIKLSNKPKLSKEEIDEINAVYKRELKELNDNNKYYYTVDPEIGSITSPEPYYFSKTPASNIPLHIEFEGDCIKEPETMYDLINPQVFKNIVEAIPSLEEIYKQDIVSIQKEKIIPKVEDPNLIEIHKTISEKYPNFTFEWVHQKEDSFQLSLNGILTKFESKMIKSIIDGIKFLKGDEEFIKQTIINLLSEKIEALF